MKSGNACKMALHDSSILRAHTNHSDPKLAIKEMALSLSAKDAQLTILFISNKYGVENLGEWIAEELGENIIACTTAGEISSLGFEKCSMTGISFHGETFLASTTLISDLNDFSYSKSQELRKRLKSIRSSHQEKLPDGKSFALLLVDGLCMKEELLGGIFASALEDIPAIGGSAGDDLHLQSTYIYGNGRFRSNQATVTVITTTVPFEVFKSQHFKETNKKFVITSSNPQKRIVYEIDGRPAAEAYARALGVAVKDFTHTVFSKNPVMLKVGEEFYVRSIQRINDDQSITFFCAIDNGLVLTLAKRESLLETTQQLFRQIEEKLGPIDCSLLFECVLRRLEVMDMDIFKQKQIMELYKKNNSVGFHTYGEQYGGIHINQTLTGIAFGKK